MFSDRVQHARLRACIYIAVKFVKRDAHRKFDGFANRPGLKRRHAFRHTLSLKSTSV